MRVITKIEPTAAAPKKKLRVAAYARVSTGSEEQLVSLETQKSHYEDYIQSNPEWEYAGLYYDEGITGTKKDVRPALMRMIRDCEDGKIDFIVTKSLSRFARNTTDCLELVRKLLGLNIPIFFEKENLNTGEMESELLLSIMSSLAESESVSISENSQWSIKHRFQNGTFKIGYAPYGYSSVEGELQINEEEAVWVRYIFSEFLSGKGTSLIARALNEQGVPSRRSNHWTQTTVNAILTNEKVTGDCLFQKTYTDSRFNRHRNTGERDQYYVSDHHEAIISHEDFEQAARLMERNGREKGIEKDSGKYQKRYPFSGRIICGECGTTFKRRQHYSTHQTYVAWTCGKHLEDVKACSMKYVKDDALQRAFVTMLNKLTFGKDVVLKPLLEALRDSSEATSLRRINQIEARLEKIAERRESLTTIAAKGYLEPALFNKENMELVSEADALESEKENLTRSISGNLKRTDALGQLVKFTGKGRMLTEFDAKAFEAFVDHITVESRTEVTFHLKCGLNLRERMD